MLFAKTLPEVSTLNNGLDAAFLISEPVTDPPLIAPVNVADPSALIATVFVPTLL
jgi:hypothetical protein